MSVSSVKKNKKTSDLFSLNFDLYKSMYEQSIMEPDKFWAKQAENFVSWTQKWTKVSDCDFTTGRLEWFSGAKLNVCYNCLDRHLPEKANQTAIYWEGDNSQRSIIVSYQDLYQRVCRFANTLKNIGVNKGDTVCLYLPMLVDSVVAMLACARIGAVHSVVFGGFSPRALENRIQDGNCRYLITADEAVRGGKTVPLKANVDQALSGVTKLRKVLVIKNSGSAIKMQPGRDIWYHEASRGVSLECEPVICDAEDPLFILYTSGSTGKPKGVLHTCGGYLLYAAMTFKYVFDYQPQDVWWCTADIGWVTGHTYGVYGPLANGATSVIYEGVPTGPDPSLVWKIVDKYKVSLFYTAPTAIRALMAFGEQPLSQSTRDSLRILGTVGEPINPEAWRWYHQHVGKSKCLVVDTWWQTETGGIMLAPLPGLDKQKPGAACVPFFGVKPAILTTEGDDITNNDHGMLVIKNSWPGQMRTVYGDHDRFVKTYFSQFPGFYFSGDGAYRDAEGDYWIEGRIDDVINVSGHRLGTAEIESALVQHAKVAEAAVIGIPHAVKGQALYGFVTLNQNEQFDEKLRKELENQIVSKIGKFAKPEFIQWAPKLPKTRSGKIMRRILRCIAVGDLNNIGDVSTLAEADVVNSLLENARA